MKKKILFFVYLCLEKLSKGLWVKENPNSNHPPRIHDIKHLIADTSFTPNAEQSRFIDDIQKYQIEGRYPDYKRLIDKYTTKVYTDDLIKGAKNLKECLREKIS